MLNSEYEEFIYTTSLLYHWFNNQDKILELYKNNDQNVKLVKLINDEAKKLMLNSHLSNHLKYRSMMLFSDEINLFLDIVVNNSYFFLKPNIKPEKCSIMKITMLKEIQIYGMRHWYSPIMLEPTLPKHMQQTKQLVTRLNDVNNHIKEKLKWITIKCVLQSIVNL